MVRSPLPMKTMHTKRTDSCVKTECSDSKKEENPSSSSVQSSTSTNEVANVNVKQENHEVCRVCLKEANIPIYGDSSYTDISDYLNTFGGIEVNINDPYPKFLCGPCNHLLEGAILFRKTAQQTDKQLKLYPPVAEVLVKNETTKLEDDFEDSPSDNGVEEIVAKVRKSKLKNYCTICKISFKSLITYKKHLNGTHESLKPELKEEKESKELLKNKKVNLKTETHKEYSNKILEKNDLSANVMSKVKKTKPNRYCVKCDINFKTLREHNDHKKAKHKEDETQTCPICNRTYASKYYPKHLISHEGHAPYMCDQCGKKFVFQSTFVRHRAIHSNDLPLKCTLCPYKGRDRYLLKLHMRKHTGERPYLCTECPKKFITKSNLNKHMLTHTAVRNFKCEICDRGFYTKTELESHIKSHHLGLKEHICSICGKAFGQRSVMMKHQRRVHKRKKMMSGLTPVYLKVATMQEQEQVTNTT